jgi:hypothetical protein
MSKAGAADTRTMRYQLVDDVCLLVHGEEPPTNADWGEYLGFLQTQVSLVPSPRFLLVTDGVAPTPTQRARLNALVGKLGRPVPTAVITHSRLARGVVAILRLFNSAIRAFAPNELSSAMEYLEIDPARRTDLLDRIVQMRIEISRPSGSQITASDLHELANEMDSLMVKRLQTLRSALKR